MGVYLSADQRYAGRIDRDGPVPKHCPDLGPCWVWVAGRTSAGYGRMSVGGKDTLVHRWAYERFVGPIPVGLEPDHLCRNKACVNVAHLEVVTHRENTLRGVRRPFCKYGHEYTPENSAFIGPNRSRICRECGRVRNRTQYQRRKQLKELAAA